MRNGRDRAGRAEVAAVARLGALSPSEVPVSVSRAVLVAALLAAGGGIVPAAADPLPCRVVFYPPEVYTTPWGSFGYVDVAPPYVDCT